jgi:DNA damage-inducible protein 1
MPLVRQRLFLNGIHLNDNFKRLSEYGVKNHDVLTVDLQPAAQGPINRAVPPPSPSQGNALPTDARQVRDFFRSQPEQMSQLLVNNPPLAEAILSDDLSVLQRMLDEANRARSAQLAEQARRIAQLEADPFNEEAQRAIEQEIFKNQVEESFMQAMEHNPEAFASVYMLYVACQINGKDIKAFVDSGAQSTIISKNLAEKCGLLRLVDTRFAGVAKGVGTAKILGRIHMVQMKMGNNFFPCSLTVLDQDGVDFLFGLDMLKRHQACIDLKSNCLRIGDEEVPFLAEKDLPDYAKHNPAALTSEEKKQHGIESPRPREAGLGFGGSSASSSSQAPVSQPAPAARSNPTPAPVAQPARAPVAAAAASPFPESDIKILTDLGFSRADSIQALRVCNGNTEMAASLLFQNSGGLGF